MNSKALTVIGHKLCPYVQRVVIVLKENNIHYHREDIDLDNKPHWLETISPTGQVPVLQVEASTWLFESEAIAEYLDETSEGTLLPSEPLLRAQHRAWIRHADTIMDIVAHIIYRDQDLAHLTQSMLDITERLTIVNTWFLPQPYLAGKQFGSIDIVYAILFRYFPVLDLIATRKLSDGL